MGRGLEVMLPSVSDLFQWLNCIFSFLERRVFLPANPRIKATCSERPCSVAFQSGRHSAHRSFFL